jgi:hypothetical protein
MSSQIVVPAPPRATPEEEFLTAFERAKLPPEYKEHYLAKRQNFHASIEGFPEPWNLYLLLDKIILREFEDIKTRPNPNKLFPLFIYFEAHVKIRASMELALSVCMPEARSILRDGIEFVAHAHHMLKDPELQKTWLSKNEAADAFTAAFEANKKTGLFNGLEELHKRWGELSETGAHATINAVCQRFVQTENSEGINFQWNYCGVDVKMWALEVFTMITTFFKMEKTLFLDYEERLKLDETLLRMRKEFDVRKEILRRKLIVHYELKPPPSPTIVKPKSLASKRIFGA